MRHPSAHTHAARQAGALIRPANARPPVGTGRPRHPSPRPAPGRLALILPSPAIGAAIESMATARENRRLRKIKIRAAHYPAGRFWIICLRRQPKRRFQIGYVLHDCSPLAGCSPPGLAAMRGPLSLDRFPLKDFSSQTVWHRFNIIRQLNPQRRPAANICFDLAAQVGGLCQDQLSSRTFPTSSSPSPLLHPPQSRSISPSKYRSCRSYSTSMCFPPIFRPAAQRTPSRDVG